MSQSGPILSILIGDYGDVAKTLEALCEYLFEKERCLSVRHHHYWEDLHSDAQEHGLDLLIINMTQTLYRAPDGKSWPEATIEEIVAFKNRYRTRVLVLSSWDAPGLSDRLRSAGADSYLNLPFTLADIRPVLEQLIS